MTDEFDSLVQAGKAAVRYLKEKRGYIDRHFKNGLGEYEYLSSKGTEVIGKSIHRAPEAEIRAARFIQWNPGSEKQPEPHPDWLPHAPEPDEPRAVEVEAPVGIRKFRLPEGPTEELVDKHQGFKNCIDLAVSPKVRSSIKSGVFFRVVPGYSSGERCGFWDSSGKEFKTAEKLLESVGFEVQTL